MHSVLHISNADYIGGSARSAYKIHSGIRRAGLQSRMLVKTRITEDPDVGLIHGERPGLKLLDLVGRRVVDRLDYQYLFYPSSFEILRHPWFRDADVIQLYNTHGGFFTHRVLPELSHSLPVVWRLSDMWPLTGHCAYSYDCERWKTGCGDCPLLEEYPPLRKDRTHFLWEKKHKLYERSNLIFVVTNSWMEQVVAESPLARHFPVHRVPNGVDTTVFQPRETSSAREALGIPVDAKAVLFIAHVARAGTRKGGQYVSGAMERAASSGLKNLVLLVAGEGAESWPETDAYRTVRFGYTSSDRLLASVYSAADLMISPALAENFPNTILEGMACGTPAVAFDTGGVKDIVLQRETGYLAKHRDEEDLASGVIELLKEEKALAVMAQHCRKVVEADFTQDLQTRRMVELYESL